ncbi:MAG TPA: PP2C family protein-serine/threonine phosphatase, partial [Acidimicrobiales bacterium]|nr:PP2C family protein-serine/threonine phosphatase [Acidimicrobiales bacterium]
TGALAGAASTVNNRNENRLLGLQVRQAATALGAVLPTVQTPLVSAVGVAEATDGNAAKFTALMAPEVGTGRTFVGASLWAVGGSSPHLVASVGRPLVLTQHPAQTLPLFDGARSRLAVTTILVPARRVGYAYGSAGPSGFVAYAESSLPASPRVTIPQSSAFSELNFALYLGRSTNRSALLETTVAQLPITGLTASASVPFGNRELTLVGTSTGELGGTLSQDLPWIVAVAGVLLTLGASLMTERLVRRRRQAEDLADENERLYGEQHGIAAALQRVLLPNELPEIPGLDIESRYLPGIETLDIGGDWYDVISYDDEHFLFVIGDVSGRGLGAATIMASLHYAIRAYAAEGDRPGAILTKLGALLDVDGQGHFATVLCGYVDLGRRQVTMASAGHFAPLMVNRDGGNYVDIEAGPPIGVKSNDPYRSTTFSVPVQATLLAFTDGLVERRGEHLDVGLERLRQSAMSEDGGPESMLARVITDLMPNGSDDDTALLGLTWLN